MLELLILDAALVAALAVLPRRNAPAVSYLEIRETAREATRRR